MSQEEHLHEMKARLTPWSGMHSIIDRKLAALADEPAGQPAQGRWQPTDEELARWEEWRDYEGLTSISKPELAALEAEVEALRVQLDEQHEALDLAGHHIAEQDAYIAALRVKAG